MKAFHDTRDPEFRSPYGAIELGVSVELTLDVWDAPSARASLRTWVDGAGETLYEMAASPSKDGATRFAAQLKPSAAGTVWYQFVITDSNGDTKRYGALEGQRGGTGRLLDWEPPSFQLTVFDPEALADKRFEGSEGSASFLHDDDTALCANVLGFLRGEVTARRFVEAIRTAHEILPSATFANCLDFLNGKNRARLLAQLSGMDEQSINNLLESSACNEPDSNQGQPHEPALKLDAHHAGVAKGRLWCAALIQLLMPGFTLAGDAAAQQEALAQWGLVDPDCRTIMENALDFATTLPPLENCEQNAASACVALDDDVVALWRENADGTKACLLVNASLQRAHDEALPVNDSEASEVIAGYGLRMTDSLDACDANDIAHAGERCVITHLNQLGTAVLLLHPRKLLQKPMEPGFGVLAHITSLPSNKSAHSRTKTARSASGGRLGAHARAFVNWLAEAGVKYWQVLPANPTDEFGSPYAGISAFAGNIRLLDDDAMPSDDQWPQIEASEEYQQFCDEQKAWLEPYVSFMAIRDRQRSKKAWQSWPKKYRTYDPEQIKADPKLAALASHHRHEQFVFEREWKALRTYAAERGVLIIGDMPIYVSADSADVWAHPELFQLGADGNPQSVAGCPPDAFAEDGQVWGNPVYDWDAMQKTGYDWWLRRLERAFDLYDFVRLDHFIGFARYFSIPAGELATEGAYNPGPGIKLFHKAFETFGPLPIIAEDLGLITPAVRALVAECGFPGMDIVQFVDGNDPLSGYTPRPGKIVYTGTHDNQTLVGYCAERYPHLDACEAAEELARKAASCAAPVCIMPLQDLMSLDDEARMNVPGTAEGNWTWQAERAGIDQALAYTRELVKLHSQRTA